MKLHQQILEMSRLFCILLLIATISLSSTAQDDDDDDDDIPGPPISDEEFRDSANIPDVFEEPEVNPEELAGLFEGDIALDPVKNDSQFRNAIRRQDEKWPGAVIPYKISSKYDGIQRKLIAKAMEKFHEKTCIRFKERKHEDDYIYIKKTKHCSSHVGRTGGKQTVKLSGGCFSRSAGHIIHELMHAVGFHHEQCRTDRDRYVNVHWANIKHGEQSNFKKYNLSKVQLLGPYDMCSIMHYPRDNFSKRRGKPTLTALRQPTECYDIGQRNDLSYLDIRKLNTLYQCKGYPQLPCEDNIDYSDWCEEKARKKECENYQLQTFVMENCKKSCKVCGV